MWFCKAQCKCVSMFMIVLVCHCEKKNMKVGPQIWQHACYAKYYVSMWVLLQMCKCAKQSVHMWIVHLQLSLCTRSHNCVRKKFTFPYFLFHSHLMSSPSHWTLQKFSTSRFVCMHIWNVKVPKLFASPIARSLHHSNYQSSFYLWIA